LEGLSKQISEEWEERNVGKNEIEKFAKSSMKIISTSSVVQSGIHHVESIINLMRCQ
jgi:hypothetical protein